MSTEADDLRHLSIALAGLSPITSRMDRDGLLHAAGRIDGERKALPWKRAALGLAGAVLALGAWMALRGPRVVERVVVVREPAIENRATNHDLPSSYMAEPDLDHVSSAPLPSNRAQLEARWLVLRFGPDALPDSVAQVDAGAGPPVRPLESDLGLPRDSFKGLSDRRLNASAPPW